MYRTAALAMVAMAALPAGSSARPAQRSTIDAAYARRLFRKQVNAHSQLYGGVVGQAKPIAGATGSLLFSVRTASGRAAVGSVVVDKAAKAPRGSERVSLFRFHAAAPGEHIDQTARRLVASAKQEGRAVVGRFNGSWLVANPGDSAKAVAARWEAERDSPAEQRRAVAARAKSERAGARALRGAEREIAKLAKTPPRTGAQLVAAMKIEAEKAGYRAFDYYAARSLGHPTEIREFVRYYLDAYPRVAAKNIAFAAKGGRVRDGTAGIWLKALAEFSRPWDPLSLRLRLGGR